MDIIIFNCVSWAGALAAWKSMNINIFKCVPRAGAFAVQNGELIQALVFTKFYHLLTRKRVVVKTLAMVTVPSIYAQHHYSIETHCFCFVLKTGT